MKQIEYNKWNFPMRIYIFFYNKKVLFCKWFNERLFDLAAKCVSKKEREYILKEDAKREQALKLKENVEKNIGPLYEAIENNQDKIKRLEEENEMLEFKVEVLSGAIHDIHYAYRMDNKNALEEIFAKLNLQKKL